MRPLALLLLGGLFACEARPDLAYYSREGEVGPLEVSRASVTADGAQSSDGGAANDPRITVDPRRSYPQGPYGADNPAAGERTQNLALYGLLGSGRFHVGPKGEIGQMTLEDLRRSTHSHLILHVGALWCSSSERSAGDLRRFAAALDAAGGLVIEALVDGSGPGVDPTMSELRDWQQFAGTDLPVVTGADDTFRSVFPGYEHAYIIRLDTMVVEWHGSGASPEQSIVGALTSAFLGSVEL